MNFAPPDTVDTFSCMPMHHLYPMQKGLNFTYELLFLGPGMGTCASHVHPLAKLRTDFRHISETTGCR